MEHMLLALAREESQAARAIASSGATYDALRGLLGQLKPDPDLAPPPRWSEDARPTPRLANLTEGVRDDTPESWLVAILGEPVSLAASALRDLAGGRHKVADALRELGIDVGELPSDPPWLPHGDPVYVPADRLEEVLRVAAREVGVGFGFNITRDGRGKLSAPAGVDLQAIVARALGDA